MLPEVHHPNHIHDVRFQLNGKFAGFKHILNGAGDDGDFLLAQIGAFLPGVFAHGLNERDDGEFQRDHLLSRRWRGTEMRRRLQEARKEAGLTQAEMAERLGISERHYQRIEAGLSNGDYRHWDALEDLLGVHQRKLRERTDIRPDKEESQWEPDRSQPARRE